MLHLARLISALMVLATLAACVPNVSHGIQTYRVATSAVPGGAAWHALAVGVLGGQVNGDGTACFWIGDGPDMKALFWPYGYKAHQPPLGVSDETGANVAVVGERVSIGGGLFGEDGSSIVGCRGFTRFWAVGSVGKAT